MRVTCKCPLCNCDAEMEKTLVCTIYFCTKCREFEINTFEKQAMLTDEEKRTLANYFENAADDDPLRKTIITKDNYKEIVQHCKK